MTIEIKAPTFPESVADGEVVAWHKQAGEAVSRDELLVEIETDKVVLEVVAPNDGVIKEIHVPEGTVIESEALLATLVPGEGAAAGPAASAAAPETTAAKHPRRQALRRAWIWGRQRDSLWTSIGWIRHRYVAREKPGALPRRMCWPICSLPRAPQSPRRHRNLPRPLPHRQRRPPRRRLLRCPVAPPASVWNGVCQ